MPCHRSQPRLSGPLLGHEVPLDRLRRGLARFATKTVCGSSDALPSFSPSSLYLVFSSSSSSSSPSSSSSSCDSLESISNSWILAGFRDVGMYSFLFFLFSFFLFARNSEAYTLDRRHERIADGREKNRTHRESSVYGSIKASSSRA